MDYDLAAGDRFFDAKLEGRAGGRKAWDGVGR